MGNRYIILAANAGSSSLKTRLFEAHNGQLKSLVSAQVSGFTSPPATQNYVCGDQKSSTELPDIHSHDEAFQHILRTYIEDSNVPQVNSHDDIDWVCHRVVHGGDFSKDQIITPETYHRIEQLEDLAPLHNASAVTLISSCIKLLPKVKNLACFDSGFHHTLPDAVKTYVVDQKVAREKGLRKYGFHGASYKYITRTVAKYLNKDSSDTSIIALHLGSGASACAIRDGQSIDTTMGLTPVSGLPGATRSGDIDPSLIFHFTSDASKLSPSSTKDLHISTAEDILNKQSGWKALTGTTDFAKIARTDAPASHQLALDIFVDRIVGYIGNYYVKLDGQVDALVFAGGIGEKSALLRKRVVQKCACLGFTIDDSKNDSVGDASVVEISSSSGSKMKTLVCVTDEEYEMAHGCVSHFCK